MDGDPDPIRDMYDWHGTRCAGLVAAAKDGAACGVGVAYNAKFGGLLCGLVLPYVTHENKGNKANGSVHLVYQSVWAHE